MNGFHFNGWPLLPRHLQEKLRHVSTSLRMPQNLRKIMGRWPTAEPRQRRDSELGKIPSFGFLFVSFSEGSSIYYSVPKLVNGTFICFFVKMWSWREILKTSQFPGRFVQNWQTHRLKSHSLMRLATQVVLWTSTYGLHPREVRTQGCCSTWQRCERSNMWSKLRKTPRDICWEALSFDLKKCWEFCGLIFIFVTILISEVLVQFYFIFGDQGTPSDERQVYICRFPFWLWRWCCHLETWQRGCLKGAQSQWLHGQFVHLSRCVLL